MSEIKRYQGYEADIARWKAEHKHMPSCERCGNGGNYKCPEDRIMTCKDTLFSYLPPGAIHFHRVTGIGEGGVIMVPYAHGHPCNCDRSGGRIAARQREFERGGS